MKTIAILLAMSILLTACSQNVSNTESFELDGTYTLAEIATQTSTQNCWSAINGSVYNLTRSIESHPGGKSAIMDMCGVDATEAFLEQHGESERIMQGLEEIKIGEVEE